MINKKVNSKDEKNVFFDINKLPAEKGFLLFGLSMNKLDRGGGGGGEQTAEDCANYTRIFHPSKVSKPLLGLNLIYGDFLYLYSDKPAPELKNSFMHQVIQHKNSFQK